jgi:hypothetical protein
MEDVGMLWPFGIVYGQLVNSTYRHLVHFGVIWYFLLVLVCCTETYLATLLKNGTLTRISVQV